MRLLLTRAAEDAARTGEKLEALGHTVVRWPVIEMVGTGAMWPPGVVDALVATSGRAVTFPIAGLAPEVRRVIPLYLVGTRTAQMARDRGFLGATTVDRTAADLASALKALAVRPRRIVYLAGRDRKQDLEMALDAIGQRLDVVEVYAARARDMTSLEVISTLSQNAVDGVLHFSRRSADLYLVAMGEAAAGLDQRGAAHFCLSEDVAAPLREAGCATIHVAETPSEADLLALVGRV